MKLLSRALLFTLVAFSICSSAANAQNKEQNLDQFFTAEANTQGFTGNVLVADHGKIIYEKSFGYADQQSGRLNTPTTQFPVASVTKTLVATAILQLQEKGRLEVADRVTKYLPDFPYPDITLVNLLSHTSGLPDFGAFFDSLRSHHPDTILVNKDLINGMKMNKVPLLFQPGERYSYCNTNFAVLGIIVERITGIGLHEYLDRYILKPAGMHHTFFPGFNIAHYTIEESKNLSIPLYYPHLYSNQAIDPVTLPVYTSYWHSYNFKGYSETITTLGDLLKFDEALYDGRLLSAATLKEAFTPVKLNDGRINPGIWGLGWQIYKTDTIVGHSGGMLGASTGFARNIIKHYTAIVFYTGQNTAPSLALNALAILDGSNVDIPKKSAAYAFGRLLLTKGQDAAQIFLTEAKKDTANFEISDFEFNALGYDLLDDNKGGVMPPDPHYTDALLVFKLNM